MSLKEMSRKDILRMVKQGELSTQEGAKLLKDQLNIKKDNGDKPHCEKDVAIIGISGRFPQAKNVDEFWRILHEGKDCICEIPKKRWDTEEFYDPDIKVANKTYCKWGGVIEDYDKFDALFFNISPKEAEIMDPQQRIILEESWKAIEDSGYSVQSLSGAECGVFIGATQGDYGKRVIQNGINLSAQLLTGTQISMLAARISYMLNLNGPNITIDTACSTSLVAINLACKSIQEGESSIAIAGGINILTTPEMYIMTSKGDMLSRDGKCKAFDNSADGFVPSEGVGVLVLKRLDKAIADKDHIYGVIIGSKVNHDGKTNGITAPSAQSQYKLETNVYDSFKINPETITYVEAHGTGTKLGDPIEVSALTKAFRHYTQKQNYCAIGSVKSNLGHALIASGVLSVIKVLLCMKHKTLVPTIHYNQCNEHIDFKNSPFFVNTELRKWEVPDCIPRRAAISSFGLSGTNCHMVLEEAPILNQKRKVEKLPYYLVIFSAKSKESLINIYCNLCNYMERNDAIFEDVIYTLNTGRGQLEIRSYLIVQTKEELINKLGNLIKGNKVTQYGFSNLKENASQIVDDSEAPNIIVEELAETVDKDIYLFKLEQLAQCYLKGFEIDFQELYTKKDYRKISLPTYPFNTASYWIDYKIQENKIENSRASQVQYVHPVIDLNVSNFDEIRFIKTFKGDEFYMREHVFNHVKFVPGVIHLEMAMAAVELLTEKNAYVLRDIQWIKPIKVTNYDTKAFIKLAKVDDEVEYTIVSENEEVYSKGKVKLTGKRLNNLTFDIQSLKEKALEIKTGDFYYGDFKAFGMEYGLSFQVIKEMYIGKDYCLAKLQLAQNQKENLSKWTLHPSLMDGALQVVVAFKEAMGIGICEAYLPSAIEQIEIFEPLEEVCYVHAKIVKQEVPTSKTQCFNLNIINSQGKVVAQINNYKARYVNKKSQNKNENCENMLYFKSKWEKSILNNQHSELIGDTIVFTQQKEIVAPISAKIKGNLYVVHMSDRYSEDNNTYTINPNKIEDYEELIQHLIRKRAQIKNIIYISPKMDVSEPYEINESIGCSLNRVFYLSKELLKVHDQGALKLVYVTNSNDEEIHLADYAIEGFAKTMVIENPQFIYKIVHIERPVAESVETIINELAVFDNAFEVRYSNQTRWIKVVEELNKSAFEPNQKIIKQQGTYIITGGNGGLGLIFAEYLAEHYRANVVLVGRSEPLTDLNDKIGLLNKEKRRVVYIRGDVTKLQDVQNVVNQTKEMFGTINGILHSAGILKDAYIRYKTQEQMESVWSPKIKGLVNLDESTKDEPLDFLVAFSTVGSITGNIGQCDYAYANSFMDYYMEYRKKLVKSQKRSGISLAINWPLWEKGGMHVDAHSEQVLKRQFGMVPLSTENGIKAFEYGLAIGESNIIVMEGIVDEMRTKFVKANRIQSSYLQEKQILTKEIDYEELYVEAKDYIKGIIAQAINLDPNTMYDKEAFEVYGIDSVMIVSINEELEKYFGKISKTLLFEYQNLESLTNYFVTHMRVKLIEILGLNKTIDQSTQIKVICADNNKEKEIKESVTMTKNNDIAIIGISGKYPMADDLDVFWNNLKEGKDCITEIPSERWDYRAKSHSGHGDEQNGGYCKWGGFISDVDKFDALYFNISPREAEMTDPQERLFLETAWKAVQNAGYTKETLCKDKVGVFVGAMYGHYELFGVEQTMLGNTMALNSTFASIANRVSYYFDLKGPSMVVDTMCSSSITALHLACQSIRNKECDSAIAGGVNLSLHENKYILLSQGNFLSSDGKCRSFGENADGYVPGEGVGTVLVKSLAKAEADGDYIYAVIKASTINHGGKTNGYTVPNPVEQGNLIKETIEKANIPAETVSYIEAHGTGTALGDPIELTGLMRGMELSNNIKCAVGSVKSNIGHLESASGIAALTKVVMMMQYKQKVPSIHSTVLNKNLDMENTPFYVQQKTEEWKRPILIKNGNQQEYPRRAGISSFGAGGSNGHIILEEYQQALKETKTKTQEQLIILSARNQVLLKKYAEEFYQFISKCILNVHHGKSINIENKEVMEQDILKLLASVFNVSVDEIDRNIELEEYGIDIFMVNTFVQKINEKYDCTLQEKDIIVQATVDNIVKYVISYVSNRVSSSSDKEIELDGVLYKEQGLLESISYTLQQGRDMMSERLAIRTNNLSTLQKHLENYLNNNLSNEKIYVGTKKGQRIISESEDNELNDAIRHANLDKLACLWTKGLNVTWEKLLHTHKVSKVPMPVSPLNSKRYWYDGFKQKVAKGGKTEKVEEVKKMPIENLLEQQMLHAYNTYRGDEVTLEIIDEQIALVIMQDRINKNMYSDVIIDGLMAKFQEIKNNAKIKVAIVTGYDHIFCMGGMQDQLFEIADRKKSFLDAPFLYKGLLKLDIPVISAMQGHAQGGGMLFGMYADITILSRESVYTAPFTKYGFTPGMGATFILKEKLGNNIATEMMFTAKSFTGEELEQRGASVIFRKQKDVLNEAIRTARLMAEKPKLTLSLLKRELADRILPSLDKVIEREEEMHQLTFSNPEVKERIDYYYLDSKKRTSSVEAKSKIDKQEDPNEIMEQILTYLEEGKITPEQASLLMQ